MQFLPLPKTACYPGFRTSWRLSIHYMLQLIHTVHARSIYRQSKLRLLCVVCIYTVHVHNYELCLYTEVSYTAGASCMHHINHLVQPTNTWMHALTMNWSPTPPAHQPNMTPLVAWTLTCCLASTCQQVTASILPPTTDWQRISWVRVWGGNVMSYDCCALVSKAAQSSIEYLPSEASGKTRTLR